MKVKIKNLRPNPFRDIKNYPIDETRVDSLVFSIRKTEFWGNTLARPHPNGNEKVQLAYGHHRLEALWIVYGKKSEKTVDIPVKNLTDDDMLRIMIDENKREYAANTKVMDDGMLQVWRRLMTLNKIFYSMVKDKRGTGHYQFYFSDLPIPEPVKDDSENGWRHSVISKQIEVWLKDEQYETEIHVSIKRLKEEGRIEEHERVEKIKKGPAKLKIVEPSLSQTAVESMPSIGAAEKFRKSVKKISENKKFGKKVSHNAQEKAAIRINEAETYSSDYIKNRILEAHLEEVKPKKERKTLTKEEELKDLTAKAKKNMLKSVKKLNEIADMKEGGLLDEQLFYDVWEKIKFEVAFIKLTAAMRRIYDIFGGEEKVLKKLKEGGDENVD